MDKEVDFVDLENRYVQLIDGSKLHISSLFDSDGNECCEFDAVTVVAGSNESGWVAIDLIDSPDDEYVTVH